VTRSGAPVIHRMHTRTLYAWLDPVIKLDIRKKGKRKVHVPSAQVWRPTTTCMTYRLSKLSVKKPGRITQKRESNRVTRCATSCRNWRQHFFQVSRKIMVFECMICYDFLCIALLSGSREFVRIKDEYWIREMAQFIWTLVWICC